MKEFRFEDYQGNYVMHCKTKEEAIEFCRLMHEDNRRWRDGDSYLEIDEWEFHEEDTCYLFNKGELSSKSCYEERKEYTILEWSDFKPYENKQKEVFRFEDYTKDKGNYVMNCKTKEEAIEFCQLMHDSCKKWRTNWSYLNDNCWGVYKENTCYNFNRGACARKKYYEECEYTILEWSDFTTEDIETTTKEEYTSTNSYRIVIRYKDCNLGTQRIKCENKCNIKHDNDFFYIHDEEDNIVFAIKKDEVVFIGIGKGENHV